jgi:hypothetical protein
MLAVLETHTQPECTHADQVLVNASLVTPYPIDKITEVSIPTPMVSDTEDTDNDDDASNNKTHLIPQSEQDDPPELLSVDDSDNAGTHE